MAFEPERASRALELAQLGLERGNVHAWHRVAAVRVYIGAKEGLGAYLPAISGDNQWRAPSVHNIGYASIRAAQRKAQAAARSWRKITYCDL
jgi:hypothetical protein